MNKYPLIKAMGLETNQMLIKNTVTYSDDPGITAVRADDLEKALQAAPLWYGDKDLDSWSTVKVWADTTHTARLVCIQPIKKQTKGEAAIEMLNKIWLRKDWSGEEIQKILEMKN